VNFIITVVLTLILVILALLLFRYVGLPVYRIEALNVERLLESVLAQTATTVDWDVFTGMPIHHNPDLDKIRMQCVMLAASEMTERRGRIIFSAAGSLELQQILNQLNALKDDKN
jgi:hypothetical protein|tara:strand:- start:1124 stop:1468 length:345 start_codon:yes stop_codon:yes gene_type:complete